MSNSDVAGATATGAVSTGRAIVDGLIAHGVDTVFGIPGVQTYELFDALGRAGEDQRPHPIEVIGARHEQAVAYMAFGYAQVTGRPGVCSVVPGPGLLNASAALLSAHGANAPVVCLTSEIPSAQIGKGLGHLHEMPDQLAAARTFAKWAENVWHPSAAPGLVAEAFAAATTGRRGPAVLAAPWDVLPARGTVPACRPLEVAAPAPDPAQIERAVALLARAERPMIMVGSGAQDAPAEVLALAEALDAPVVSFRGGRGVVESDHPLGFSCAEGHELWATCDALVGIGSRLELTWLRWPPRTPRPPLVLVDVDPHRHVRLGADVRLVSDAAATCRELTEALAADRRAGSDGDREARRTELAAAKERIAVATAGLQPHLAYLGAIRRALPRDGVFVEEICQMGFTSYFGFPVHQPRTFVTCGYQGTLGFGFPTALGAKAARRDRPVVSITGDGGFLFAATELATAVQHDLGVVTVVFDNEAYGNVLADQERLFAGRAVGSRLVNPDFVALARSFGARGVRAESPDALERAVRDGIESGEPTVVHVPMPLDRAVSPWPFLIPPRPAPAQER